MNKALITYPYGMKILPYENNDKNFLCVLHSSTDRINAQINYFLLSVFNCENGILVSELPVDRLHGYVLAYLSTSAASSSIYITQISSEKIKIQTTVYCQKKGLFESVKTVHEKSSWRSLLASYPACVDVDTKGNFIFACYFDAIVFKFEETTMSAVKKLDHKFHSINSLSINSRGHIFITDCHTLYVFDKEYESLFIDYLFSTASLEKTCIDPWNDYIFVASDAIYRYEPDAEKESRKDLNLKIKNITHMCVNRNNMYTLSIKTTQKINNVLLQ